MSACSRACSAKVAISVSCALVEGEDLTPAEWLEVGQQPTVFTYRDPSGAVITGALTGSVSWQGSYSAVQSLSFTLEEGVAG